MIDYFLSLFKGKSENNDNKSNSLNEKYNDGVNTEENISYYKCKCLKEKSISLDFCDNISYILSLTKMKMDNIEFLSNLKKHYLEILNQNDEDFDLNDNMKQIDKDISRTYPTINLFKTEEGKIQLRNVLKAFSKYDRHNSKFKYNSLRICTRNEFYCRFFSLSCGRIHCILDNCGTFRKF